MPSFRTSVDTIARHVVVSGKVQGVGYRQALLEQARHFNINGWCRNLPDGRVEAWLQGMPDQMATVLSWIHRGPAGAQVEQVEVENQAVLEPMLGETIQTFEIRK